MWVGVRVRVVVVDDNERTNGQCSRQTPSVCGAPHALFPAPDPASAFRVPAVHSRTACRAVWRAELCGPSKYSTTADAEPMASACRPTWSRCGTRPPSLSPWATPTNNAPHTTPACLLPLDARRSFLESLIAPVDIYNPRSLTILIFDFAPLSFFLSRLPFVTS